jgi:hypothetical protein
MGFEPTTPTLARSCSAPELHPRRAGRDFELTSGGRRDHDAMGNYIRSDRSTTRSGAAAGPSAGVVKLDRLRRRMNNPTLSVRG